MDCNIGSFSQQPADSGLWKTVTAVNLPSASRASQSRCCWWTWTCRNRVGHSSASMRGLLSVIGEGASLVDSSLERDVAVTD